MKTDKKLPDPPGPTPILYIKEGGVGEMVLLAFFIVIWIIMLL